MVLAALVGLALAGNDLTLVPDGAGVDALFTGAGTSYTLNLRSAPAARGRLRGPDGVEYVLVTLEVTVPANRQPLPTKLAPIRKARLVTKGSLRMPERYEVSVEASGLGRFPLLIGVGTPGLRSMSPISPFGTTLARNALPGTTVVHRVAVPVVPGSTDLNLRYSFASSEATFPQTGEKTWLPL